MSSYAILFLYSKEIFPNEDGTRFNLAGDLCMMPAKVPINMHQFATWLEDCVTKLSAADEAGAHVEPCRVMSILTHVGKPRQAQDTESGVTKPAPPVSKGLLEDDSGCTSSALA